MLHVRFSSAVRGQARQTVNDCGVNVAHGLVLLFGIGTNALASWDSKTRWDNLDRFDDDGGAVSNLASSGHRIIPKYPCFHLQLAKAVLENIADANDPHELIAVLDGQMANAPLRHQLHHIGDVILG